jgi:PPP family 3-phenylpropionic acid transporter
MRLRLRSTYPPEDRALWHPRAYYALFFGGMAWVMPFLVLRYQEIGLSGEQIGLLTVLGPVVTLVASPFWGGLADATRRHKQIMLVNIVAAVASMLLIGQMKSFWALIPVVASYSFFIAPIVPLVDRTVVDLLGARKADYGRQRLWGSIGWGIMAPLAGWVVGRTGLTTCFYGYAFFMILGMIVAARMIVSPPPMGEPFWKGMRVLLSDRRLLFFMVAMLMQGMGRSASFNFLYMHLSNLGGTKLLVGLAATVAGLSELPTFFYSGVMMRRIGARGLFVFSMVTGILMLTGYSLIRNPWLVLFVQLLTGPSFSTMWAGGVAYMDELAPRGMGATAQGLFSAVATGLASALGAIIGGWMFDAVGAPWMFRWSALMVFLALLFLLITSRTGRAATAPTADSA